MEVIFSGHCAGSTVKTQQSPMAFSVAHIGFMIAWNPLLATAESAIIIQHNERLRPLGFLT